MYYLLVKAAKIFRTFWIYSVFYDQNLKKLTVLIFEKHVYRQTDINFILYIIKPEVNQQQHTLWLVTGPKEHVYIYM